MRAMFIDKHRPPVTRFRKQISRFNDRANCRLCLSHTPNFQGTMAEEQNNLMTRSLYIGNRDKAAEVTRRREQVEKEARER